MKASKLTTSVNLIRSKMVEIEQMEKQHDFINIYNEDGTYNFENLSKCVSLNKQININNGALKRMIQKAFDIYYNGNVNWLSGKMTYEYIREFNKTFLYFK